MSMEIVPVSPAAPWSPKRALMAIRPANSNENEDEQSSHPLWGFVKATQTPPRFVGQLGVLLQSLFTLRLSPSLNPGLPQLPEEEREQQDSPVRRKHSTSYSGHGSPEPAAGSWSPWSRSSGGGRTTLRSSSASQSLEAGPQPLLLSQGSGRSGRRRSHGPASADALDGYEEEPSLRRHSYNCPEDGYKSDSEGSSSSSSSTLGPEDEELEDEGSDEELEETEGEEGMAPPASRRGASVPIGMPGGPRRPLASSGSAVDWQSMLRARPMPMRPVATAPQGLASQDQADETCEEEEEEASEEELGAGHAETSAQEEEEDEEALATAYSSPYDSASPGTSPKRAAVLLAPKPPRPPSHLKPHAASSTAACKPAAAAGALPVPQPRHQHNHSAPQALSTASDLLAPELSASPGSQAGSPMQPGLASAAAAAGAGSPAANGERCPASSAEAGKSPEAKGMASKASPPGKTGNSISFSSISEWPPESTSSQLLRDAPDMRAHVQPQELTPPRPLPPALVPSEAEPRCSAAAAAAAAVSAAVPPRMLDTASAAVAAMASAGAAAAAALQKQEAEQRAARSQAADAMALAPVQQPGALVPAALASPASTASGALTPRTFVPVRMAMGTYSDKGPREKMEDFVFALPLPKPGSAASDAAAEAGLPSSGACSFTHAVCFGVFDGHNGASTAKDLAEKVPVGLKEGVAHIAAHGPSHMGDILAGHERRLRHQRHYGHHHRHHGHHHHGHHHGGSGSGNGHAHIQHHGHPRVQVHPLRPHVHLALPHGPHSNGHAHARVHAHVVAEPCPARAVSMPGDMPCNSAQAALDSAGSAPLPLPAPEPPSQEGLRQLQVQVPEAGEQGWERGAQGQADEPQLVSSPGSLGPLTHALHHAHTSSWTDSDYACASSSVPASPAPGMVNGAQEVRPALPWAVPLPQGAAGGDGFSYGTAAVGNGNGHVDVPTDSEQPGSSNGVGGNHGPVEEDDSGSTALVAAVIDGSVFVANIGDCRLILAELGDNGKVAARRVTCDHSASNPAEAARLAALRVEVGEDNHIGNSLQVSRSIGDFGAKRELGEQVIIAEAELHTVTLTSTSLFVVAVSDGVTSVLSDESIVERVCAYLNETPKATGKSNDPQHAAEQLVKYAVDVKGSEDNSSCVVVSFWDKAPPQEEQRRPRLFGRPK